MTRGCDPLTVELFVRSLAPDGARRAVESVLERLQRLEAVDAIADLDVHVTGRKVRPNGPAARTAPGAFLLDRVAAFEAWADRTGRSVSGTFRRVEDARGIDGSDHSGVAFPTAAMAEYEDDDIRFVSPATGTAAVNTVQDRLDTLESNAAGPVPNDTGELVD